MMDSAFYSTVHSHEPEIPPTYDEEGRCRICVMLVRIESLEEQLETAQKERNEWVIKCQMLVEAVDAVKPQLEQLEALGIFVDRIAGLDPSLGPVDLTGMVADARDLRGSNPAKRST